MCPVAAALQAGGEEDAGESLASSECPQLSSPPSFHLPSWSHPLRTHHCLAFTIPLPFTHSPPLSPSPPVCLAQSVSGVSVQSYMEDLLFRIPHLQLLLVTDKDGVQILKSILSHSHPIPHPPICSVNPPVHTPHPFLTPFPSSPVPLLATSESFGDQPVDAGFSVVFHTSSEQSSKLGLGANLYIVSTYPNHVIVQVALTPLIVTAVGDRQVNLGLVLNALPELRVKLEGTRSGVQMQLNAERERERV